MFYMNQSKLILNNKYAYKALMLKQVGCKSIEN